MNTPLAAGDALYAAEGANLELQLGARAFVRAGAGTEIGLESLERDLAQFKVTGGHAALDLRRLPSGLTIEVDTPNGAFTIDRPGYYRVDVDGETTTFITRRDGQASVVPAGGEATDIGPDQQVVIEGTDTARLTTHAGAEPDEWDRWNFARTERRGESKSARYLPPDMPGGDELDEHGEWRDMPRYGPAWVPSDVPEGWAPYSTGRWIWDPYYGWTWVDDAPWGWAPYHYGRWVFASDAWAWVPGPIVVAPVYAPALVAFLGPPAIGVSIGIGFPFVSWVSLSFGEPLIPWWGPPGFIGACWWGGWGGPHIVNNIVIQHNTFVNVRNVNVFRNTTVHNGVIAVHRDRFGRGRADHVRVARADAQRLHPIRGGLGVKPARASLVAREGPARRPPENVHTRPVVATRPPQDPARRLHAAGLDPGPVAKTAPPRLVEGPRRGRAPGGASPRTTPPPPHMARQRPGESGGRPTPPPRASRPQAGSTGRREASRPSGRGAERGGGARARTAPAPRQGHRAPTATHPAPHAAPMPRQARPTPGSSHAPTRGSPSGGVQHPHSGHPGGRPGPQSFAPRSFAHPPSAMHVPAGQRPRGDTHHQRFSAASAAVLSSAAAPRAERLAQRVDHVAFHGAFGDRALQAYPASQGAGDANAERHERARRRLLNHEAGASA
jgi:hypothetical protein